MNYSKKRNLAICFVFTMVFLAISGFVMHNVYAEVTNFSDAFNNTDSIANWTTHGGNWKIVDGQYSVTADSGAKSIAAKTNFTDITYDVDVKVTANQQNAGLLFRASNLSVGADSFNGYYVGIGNDGNFQGAILGKSNGSWTEIARKSMIIDFNVSHHIKVVAISSKIKIYVDDMNTPKIDISDDSFNAGSVGFRTWKTDIKYDNVIANVYEENINDTARGIASKIIEIKTPTNMQNKITMPEIPEGYSVKVKLSQPSGRVLEDGTIIYSEEATDVTLVLNITKKSNNTSADTIPIKIRISPTKNVFIIDSLGGKLDRTDGVTAKVEVSPTTKTHGGDEVVVFELMDADMPMMLTAIQSDITGNESKSSQFYVDDSSKATYKVYSFVMDTFEVIDRMPNILSDMVMFN